MSSKDKKYKYTRQLLKIAKQEGGYTNKDIEKKAGLSGSSGSLAFRWLNGHAVATERQMRYFINNYGQRLKRSMEHVYYTDVIKEGEAKPVFIKVSGEVIFKYQIKVARDNRYFGNSKAFSVLRFLVLRDGNKFNLLYQFRAGLLDLVEHEVDGKKRGIFTNINPDQVHHADNEEGNWYLYTLERELEFDKLVLFIQKWCSELIDGSNVIDGIYRTYINPHNRKSVFFDSRNIYPLELAFYQKMLSLDLHSEHYPF